MSENDNDQLTHARISLAIAEGRWLGGVKACPWCPPADRRGRAVPLGKCTTPEHTDKLAYCRQLVAAMASPAP